ncbi:hypothetical protein N0V90_013541 [Kalmusia sp. IMI 367209]|nr:hypothetical protein N0V90_013541 [Kalmusia sp. IMI 367209]
MVEDIGGTKVYINDWEGLKLEGGSSTGDDVPVEEILSKVSMQIQQLRSVPSEGYYGRVYKQEWIPSGQTFGSMPGLFNTYEEFVSGMYKSAERYCAYQQPEDPNWSLFVQFALPRYKALLAGLKPKEPKLTWLDVSYTKCVRMVPVTGTDGTKDWKVYLVGWEKLAWCPAWLQAKVLLPMTRSNFAGNPSRQKALFKDWLVMSWEELWEDLDKDLITLCSFENKKNNISRSIF